MQKDSLSKKKPTPYWTKVIKEALAKKKQHEYPVFTEAQVLKAKSWQTCACGKQSKLIPRAKRVSDLFDSIEDYYPLDRELKQLGTQFFEYIRDQSPLDAKKTLAKIEARARIVIKETLKAEETSQRNAPRSKVQEAPLV